MSINYNTIICRYDEIGIKGNNRSMFEKILIENMHRSLRESRKVKISKIRGRIWMKPADGEYFTDEEISLIKTHLVKVFGLESFSPAIMCETDMDKISELVKESCNEAIDPVIDKNKGRLTSFRVRARRSEKRFPLKSKEVEIKIADIISDNCEVDKLTVDLSDKAEITLGCEIRSEFSFIYYNTYPGPGGLPTGSNSPVLSLLSGGIDSPVSSYLTMKRGCRNSFITFHSDPYTPQESINKVKKLSDIVNCSQKRGKLYICNLAPFQKLVRDKCNEKYRTILYRRAMMKISTMLARKIKAKALVTGEAIGQVASQTVSNMSVIDASTNMLILRPLLGMDKQEVIKIAKKIGTFEVSKIQVPDSCTVFAPVSPATRSDLKKVLREEKFIEDYKEVLKKIVDDIEVYE